MASLENAPGIAASRAQDIIRAMSGGIEPNRAGLLCRKKDARVKNLFKFNLGKGFRLISIKEKDQIYVLFFGTHDQCDRWLDDNRKKNPQKQPRHSITYKVVITDEREKPDRIHDFRDLADNCCSDLPPVSQEDLRRVFCGLTKF